MQKGRTVPTLSSVNSVDNKEQLNQDTKSEERGETDPSAGYDDGRRKSVFDQMKNIPVAGRSSTEHDRKKSAGGRRSSMSGENNHSQLSVENLGGSQDNLHLLGRNPDKEMKTHSGRAAGSRSQQQQYIDNRELEEMSERTNSPYGGSKMTVQLDDEAAVSPVSAMEKVSFANLRKQKARDQFHSSGINITYNRDSPGPPDQREKEDEPKRISRSNSVQKQQQPGLTSWASSHQQQAPMQQNNSEGETPGE